MLAVQHHLKSIRRFDLETNAELLACEIKPDNRKKFLCLVFYRPPSLGKTSLKALKQCLKKANTAHFTQFLVMGDFNLPGVNWHTMTAERNDCLHTELVKLVRDHFLWQLIDKPTRGDNILDLLLTNFPDKVGQLEIFDDILNTDHRMFEFVLNFNINKKPSVQRKVYNFKKVDWNALRSTIERTPWDIVMDETCIDISLSNWMDLYLSIVNEHILQITIKENNTRPWIDKDVINILRQKNKLRKIAKESRQQKDIENYNSKRKDAKQILNNKYSEYLNDIKLSFKDNPKKFWSFVKVTTKSSSYPQFLRYGNLFSTCSVDKANIFNDFFQSVFLQNNAVECNENDRHYYSNAESFLNEIVLTQSEVYACLLEFDPGKASGPDNIPAKILKLTAEQISPSICRLFNLSLRLGVMPTAWKEANVTPVFKNGNEACVENYRPISLLCILSKVLERCVYNRIYDLFVI